MDLNTLTLYLAAGGLSLCLSLILMGFAHFQQGTRAIRNSAAAILVLAIGFLAAGIGPMLPRWATVIGTNMLLLSAGAIFYSGFSAVLRQREAEVDRFGWAVVLLTALPFWHWGLVEPNGPYRSAVFSLAAAIINGRTAWLLLGAARQNAASMPVRFLAALFGTLTLWMLARSILVLTDPVPVTQVGANPTSWVTVFWYIVLISLVTAAILWMETAQLRANERGTGLSVGRAGSMVGIARGKLSVLWTFVVILAVTVLAELVVSYGAMLQTEQAKLARNAQLANDAFVEHTAQVVRQVDTLLKAMRGYYLHTGSAEEAEHYMAGLGFDRKLISDIYLIDAAGRILTPWNELALGRNVSERAYFIFHRDNPADQIFIDNVQTGRVTGKQQFRITRRISHPDGSFAGTVVAPIEPDALTNYYRQLMVNRDDLASLLGTQDHQLRARFPAPDASSWNAAVESPVWEALARQPEGSYRSTSFIDKIERHMLYKRVDDLPLVMVTGYSAAEVRANALARSWQIALGALLFMLVIAALATILTLVLRRREEQERFMSMLNHELKTPLAVIRMALGQEGEANRARIARNIAEIDALVDRCLQTDRLDHNRIEVTAISCDVLALLDKTMANSREPDRVRLDNRTPAPHCVTDIQLLGIILSNLIDNALKYSQANSVVTITVETRQRHGKTGMGIEVANLTGAAGMPDPAQLFRKYYRAPGAHAKTGSGLGLHVAEGFARKLGGELRFCPTNETVKFALWIPL